MSALEKTLNRAISSRANKNEHETDAQLISKSMASARAVLSTSPPYDDLQGLALVARELIEAGAAILFVVNRNKGEEIG